MKKLLLILLILISSNITSFCYTIKSDGKDKMIAYFENSHYWTIQNWNIDWSAVSFLAWGYTDDIGYSTVEAIMQDTTFQTWFDDLNTAKANGTLTQEMLDAFYDAVHQAILDGNIIAAWDFNGLTAYGDSPFDATYSNSNLIVGGFTRGLGVLTGGTAENNAWGGTDMIGNNINQATDLYQDYITFTLKPDAGSVLYLDEIRAYNIQRTSDGAAYGQWQYSKDGGVTYTNIGTSIRWGDNYTTTGNLQSSIALTPIRDLQSIDANTTVTFRLLLWGATSTTGNWYLNDYITDDEDFVITGTVVENPSPFLNVDETTINGFIYSESELGPSETQSFTLIGGNLSTTTDIVITAPTDYEISTDSTSGYSSSITFTPDSSAISKKIYVRLKSDLSINTYYETLTITGGGTWTTTEVTLDGVVVECTYIWLEDFDDYRNGTQSSAKFVSSYTDPEPEPQLQKVGKTFWGVLSQKFLINDIEGNAGDCASGDKDNYLETETIDVSDYQYIKISLGISIGGKDLEGLRQSDNSYLSGVDMTAGTDGSDVCGTTDKLILYYSLSGGASWTEFGNVYGGVKNATYNFITPEIYIDALTDLRIKIVGGNTADDECYYIDNIMVSGVKDITAPSTLCQNTTDTAICTPYGGEWTSSNTSVATIDSSGVITAIGQGSTTISYTTCNGSSTTDIVVSGTIPNVTVADAYLCGTGTASFFASSDSTGTTITWYDQETDGTLLSTGETYTTNSIDTTTSYYYSVEYYGCSSLERTEVMVIISPDTAIWTGTVSTDWNDDANWNPSKPGGCSIAYIDSAEYFPDISSTQAIVNKIVFHPEASIYGLENLSYDKAYIRAELKRNKWYLLTTPLKEMYSGDFYFNGAPTADMKLFGTSNASSGTFRSSYTVTSDFTESFASLTEELTPGEGFAFYIDSVSWNYPNGTTNNAGDTLIVFPRTNADGSLVRTAIPYSGITGKLYPSLAKTMDKDSTKAFRFAMENDSNTLTSYTIHVEAGLNLIGNPLMSHLDFAELYEDNSSLISNYVQFWNGETFGTITTTGITSGSSVSGLSLNIPPMKSFVVNALEEGDLVINLSAFTPDGDVTLRSATKQNTMYIEATNKKAKSSSAIVVNENASNDLDEIDVCKLCSQLEEVPEVYTIVGEKALDINEISMYPCVIPVGIKSGLKDTVDLDFKGVESFDNIDIRLINTSTGEDIDLKENSQYAYDYDGSNGEGNLFLEFRSASAIATDDDLVSTSNITIYADANKDVHVITSPNNKALEIIVYDALGKIITKETALSNTSETISIDRPTGVFVVKVISEKGVETKKIIL